MSDSIHIKKKPRILVTGGSGFLGKRIVAELLSDDSPFGVDGVRVFDTKDYTGVHSGQIDFVSGDIRNGEMVFEACKGMDLVIHAAAIIDWGTQPEQVVLDVNVRGTQNVIDACKRHKIKRLVYTSSLDAVFTGKPLIDIDERQPYPEKHHTVYCESKKLGELAVTKAHREGLKTIILRPADIFGEADPYHIDSLIDMAKTGFYVRLGNGKAKCQHVYVGNMAYAHILAVKALLENDEAVNGQIYFITDGKASNFFRFFDRIVAGAGYKIFPPNLWLPRGLAYAIGSLSEGMARLISPFKKYNPKFSRFAVTYTCTDYTFSSDKAERALGYYPKYSREQALESTIDYYRKPV